MGLKSGSRDSGLDDAEEQKQKDTSDEQKPDQATTGQSTDEVSGEGSDETAESASENAEIDESSGSDTPSVDSIPYKLRRSKVNEGREQVPYFLRPEITDAEDQLKATLESELGETVYKSDYREAAMVVAQRRPELVAEVLREWGYDFGNR